MVSGLSICKPNNYTEPMCKSRYYSDKLPQRLKELQNELPSLLFTIYDGSNLYNDIFGNPEKYGKQNYFEVNIEMFSSTKSFIRFVIFEVES